MYNICEDRSHDVVMDIATKAMILVKKELMLAAAFFMARQIYLAPWGGQKICPLMYV